MGEANLVHNIEEIMLKAIIKGGMTKDAKKPNI
jgi:hypothetical protein